MNQLDIFTFYHWIYWKPYFNLTLVKGTLKKYCSLTLKKMAGYSQAGDTRIPLPRKSLWTPQKKCRLQSWTLYKSCGLSLSFYNNTLRKFLQIQRQSGDLNKSNFAIGWLDQSAGQYHRPSNAQKECLILKYKYIQNPWYSYLLPQINFSHLKNFTQEKNGQFLFYFTIFVKWAFYM